MITKNIVDMRLDMIVELNDRKEDLKRGVEINNTYIVIFVNNKRISNKVTTLTRSL
jgi:hypothetical protein